MSEVHERTSAFFDLYQAHRVAEDAIGDIVEAWHNTGDEETRTLSQFLGMTEDELAIWVMDARTLPLLRAARETQEKLVAAVARYIDGLRAGNTAADSAAIRALSHWAEQRANSTSA